MIATPTYTLTLGETLTHTLTEETPMRKTGETHETPREHSFFCLLLHHVEGSTRLSFTFMKEVLLHHHKKGVYSSSSSRAFFFIMEGSPSPEVCVSCGHAPLGSPLCRYVVRMFSKGRHICRFYIVCRKVDRGSE